MRVERPVDEVLAEAVSSQRDGKVTGAVDLFHAVLALQPSNAIANHQLGVIAFARGDVDSSVDFLRRAVAIDPSDSEFQNDLGVVLNALGDLRGA
jgi:Flp pilus assembly protein TadD